MITLRFLSNRPVIAFELAFSSLLVLSFLVSEGFAKETNTFSNKTLDTTAEAMNEADKLLSAASNAASNATQKAMEEAKSIMTNVTNNVSKTASNTTGASMNEANKLINAASEAASNATQIPIDQAKNIQGNLTDNVSSSGSPEFPMTVATPMTNYSSTHYQVQFQYPTNWDIREKTSRFDEGTDISASGFSPSGTIAIQYLNTSIIQNMDLQSAVYEFFKSSIDSDYKKEYKVIEQPSFVNIDNQKAGSYLFTHKDKYEEFATKWATQVWVVFVGNHGYLLSFTAPTNVFDAPEMKNIRDQFIYSIKFMGNTKQLNTNVPNRFD